MKGIQFVVDDKGNKSSVIIDLKEHGELWEDFYDTILAEERANEPRESVESVRECSKGKPHEKNLRHR